MNGFKDASFNRQIIDGILDNIVIKIFECINFMLQDCKRDSKKIANNEVKIRDYLFCNYLNNDVVMRSINFNDFRFFSEVPENYVESTPKGRVDLQVYSINEFRHRDRYFIIECKRIDGNLTLNRAYINEGIRRFVGENPQYTSYYKMNCMLGFVVKDIDVSMNVEKINQLLQTDYTDIHVQEFLHTGTVPDTYMSSHGSGKTDYTILTHAFANCTSIIG